MKRLLRCVALSLFLMPALGSAQDFDAGVAAYQSGDYATALQEWTPLAEQGIGTAQYNLGVMYANGKGVPQDFISAHLWFNISGANGDQDAVAQRDAIASKLSPADLTEAQRRAKVCMASKYQDCD